MLYEMIGIVRPGKLAEVKEIVLTTGQLILKQGGVIRDISNWGVFALPRTARLHDVAYHNGHYFAMRFDASVAAQREVHSVVRRDPRVIRAGVVGLGDGKLETMRKFGRIRWDKGM